MKKIKLLLISVMVFVMTGCSFLYSAVATNDGYDIVPASDRPVYRAPAQQERQDEHFERLQAFDATHRQRFFNAPVWNVDNPIPGEVEVDPDLIMFHGAWYHIVESMTDEWIGITAVITLPQVRLDPDRIQVGTDRYLDNSSIYLGVTGHRESDVGLIWERMTEHSDYINISISRQGMGFRPFWRFINAQGNNVYHNAPWQMTQTYFFPGDTVRMSLLGTRPEYCVMHIELLEPTTIPRYVAHRQRLNVQEEHVFVTPEFEAPGLISGPMAFKIVNAIDQRANEGRPTQPTNSSIMGAIWHSAFLFREIGGTLYKVPFSTERTKTLSAPVAEGFITDQTHALNRTTGFRTVDIMPQLAVDYNPFIR